MAIYNEILVGRFARGLQKLFGIKGGVPTKQLAGEIMAVHQLTSGVENRYVEGWAKFAFVVSSAAAAGFQSAQRFRNPTGSGVVAVFEKIAISALATDSYNVHTGAIAIDLVTPHVLTSARLDPRGTPSPSLILSDQNSQAVAPTPQNLTARPVILINTTYDLIVDGSVQEIPVLPGDCIQVTAVTVNETLVTTYFWRERPLEDSEKF